MQQNIYKLWDELRPINIETWPENQYDMDPAEYRFDDLGAIIKFSEYGKQTAFGWSVDHMLPESKGGDNRIENLQLLHWRNNQLKGNDFPTYSWNISRTLKQGKFENYESPRVRVTFSEYTLKKLALLFPAIPIQLVF